VRYVAELARIELTDAEATSFQAQLDDILGYVAQLRELGVEDIEPTAHALPRTNVLREDEAVAAGLPRECVLANAPAEVAGAFVRVPVVIEEASP
jgi:aspartyl-tRNA(Asn)/glutamyl-tRNA(Gln) amidotransferase subunit C